HCGQSDAGARGPSTGGMSITTGRMGAASRELVLTALQGAELVLLPRPCRAVCRRASCRESSAVGGWGRPPSSTAVSRRRGQEWGQATRGLQRPGAPSMHVPCRPRAAVLRLVLL